MISVRARAYKQSGHAVEGRKRNRAKLAEVKDY